MNNRLVSNIFILLFLLSMLILFGCQKSTGLTSDKNTFQDTEEIIGQCTKSIVDEMRAATVEQNGVPILNIISTVWKAEYGCTNAFSCENEEWIIYDKGDGCEVAYSLTISGDDVIIPFFYVNLKTGKIFAAQEKDIENFNGPAAGVELFDRIGFTVNR